MNKLADMEVTFGGLNGHTSDKALAERTARLLLPNDDLALAMQYLYGIRKADGGWHIPNTCALQTLAAMRVCYGIRGFEETDKKYIPFYDAVARVERLGMKLGVMDVVKSATGTELPKPGDFVRSGDFPHEHVSNVVDYDAATGDFLTLDGGNGLGSETVLVRRKILVVGDEYVWSSPFGQKPIRRILRMERL